MIKGICNSCSSYNTNHFDLEKPKKLVIEYRSADDPVIIGSKFTFGSSELRLADIFNKLAQRKLSVVLLSVCGGVFGLFLILLMTFWGYRYLQMKNGNSSCKSCCCSGKNCKSCTKDNVKSNSIPTTKQTVEME